MAPPDPKPLVPTRAGPYELLEELGRGGMGVVYLAQRADGQFEKRVAVKLLHADERSGEILARFELEQQVLAGLEHPGIARLIDGGLTEEGSPFLVMELVEGIPIDRWCEERRLTVDERLSLFREVCLAVDSAHRSLVVHRDLKPGNILVTPEGQPKLLDFGIAKVLADPSGPPQEEATRAELRPMTPAYASPEQVKGAPITTAADVYSLGVILYQLLTGRLPLLPGEDTATAWERVIAEEEPPAPSTVEGLPRKLRRKLAGDLDLIVLTALRKEPERRYRSAAELFADLRRYGAHLPIEARPDSRGYRATRFVRRNPITVAATTLVVLSLIAGLAFSTWQYRRAREAQLRMTSQLEVDRERVKELGRLTETLEVSRRQVEEQRELAESRAVELEHLTERLREESAVADAERGRAERSVEEVEHANEELSRESELAEERYHDVWALARAMVFDVRDGLAPIAGTTEATALVAELGVTLLDELAESGEIPLELASDLVGGYLRLATTLGDIGSPSRGQGSRGLELTERAVEIAEMLHARDESHLARIYDLGTALNTRGLLLMQRGQSVRAEADFARGAELCGAFLDEEPWDPGRTYLLALLTRNLGQSQLNAGRSEEALSTLEACIGWMEYCVEHDPRRSSQLHRVMTTTANVTAHLHGPSAAIPTLERACDFFSERLREHPSDFAYRKGVSVARLALSKCYADVGRLAEAVELARIQVEASREEAGDEPENAGAKMSCAHALSHLGELLARLNEWEELIPVASEGVVISEGLARQDPGNTVAPSILGQFLVQLGRATRECGREEESERHLTRAVREAEELARQDPGSRVQQVLLYSARANLAQLYRDQAEVEDAPLPHRIERCRLARELFREAREQIESNEGNVSTFGDRELILQRLRNDEETAATLLDELEGG